MELFLIFFLVVFIAMIMNGRAAVQHPDAITLKDLGACPPHQWYWQEIKDHEGVVHAHKMVCRRCGPLKDLDGR